MKCHSELSGWNSAPGGASRNLVGPPGFCPGLGDLLTTFSNHAEEEQLLLLRSLSSPSPVERGPFPALPRTYCQQFCSANSQGVSQDVYIRDVSVPVLQLERL